MVFNTLAIDADNEWMMIGCTIIRGDQHAACDALGNRVRFFVIAGQRSRYIKALDKLKHFRRFAIRYDKLDIAYMAFAFLAGIYLWLK